MKKLMILAVVALVASASQAAKFRWSASGIQNAAGTGTYSSAADAVTLYAYLSTAEASTAVAVDTSTMTAGAIANTTFEDTKHFEASKQYIFYYTMTDAKGNVFTSSTQMRTANATQTIPVGFGSGGEWATEPTPEPTSAMLMLLGVAGLALRRKQK